MFITLPKAIIYTLDVAVENQPFHLPIYSYSYLFTIIPMDYSNSLECDVGCYRRDASPMDSS